MEQAEHKKYYTWVADLNKKLPEYANRVWALRGIAYYGAGFHYSLENNLGEVIKIGNSHGHNVHVTIDMVIIDEIIVENFIETLEKAEQSAAKLK